MVVMEEQLSPTAPAPTAAAPTAAAATASEGNPRRLTMAELEANLDWLRQSPATDGRLELIVRRPAVDQREVLAEGQLTTTDGLVGDSWRPRLAGTGGDMPLDPDRQLTLINARLARLVAGHPDRRQLAGDQLFLDLDLSVENAPSGTQLRIGGAVVEITEPPHRGCDKFVARFGKDAMLFVNSPTGKALRLRGANAKVVLDGTVHVGDVVSKYRRP